MSSQITFLDTLFLRSIQQPLQKQLLLKGKIQLKICLKLGGMGVGCLVVIYLNINPLPYISTPSTCEIKQCIHAICKPAMWISTQTCCFPVYNTFERNDCTSLKTMQMLSASTVHADHLFCDKNLLCHYAHSSLADLWNEGPFLFNKSCKRIPQPVPNRQRVRRPNALVLYLCMSCLLTLLWYFFRGSPGPFWRACCACKELKLRWA